jgi:hypothetical protein
VAPLRHFAAVLALLALSLIACTVDAPPRRASPQSAAEPVATAQATPPAASGAAPPRDTAPSRNAPSAATGELREPVLVVTDPAALAAIARERGDFGRLAFGLAAAADSNADLWSNAAYRSVAEVIERDVKDIARRDPSAGVGVAGHTHRLFDVRWLRAPSAHFDLIAVTNRIDRRALDDSACGEIRFVYRLSYSLDEGPTRRASRLPMTFILELRAPHAAAGDDCRLAAQRWLAPRDLHGDALGRWLLSADGPLARERVAPETRVQLAVNLQSVRWPSAARPDLGGHAEYMLRAFRWDAGSARYRPRKLENTPDVPRLLHDAQLRAALRAWIATPDNLARLDSATAIIPDEFLAESIVSVTPRGFARRQNRAYRRLFAPSDFADLPLSELRFARSPEALVRRLDDLTCNGCHQSRSIAGFHLVGEDVDAAAGNALAGALSPHALSDLERRKAYLLGLAGGMPLDGARPFAEHAPSDRGGYGAHCGLGDPGFTDWRCAAGLHCDAYEAPLGEQTVGVCLPDTLRVGDPCQPGRVQQNDDAHRDHARNVETQACDYVCEVSRVGFPGGMCASACDALPSDATCGGIAILTDFNNCLARREPFAQCVADHVRPAGLRACSAEAPCRDDYICARTPSGGGACLPPYFVFQLRVDGHP